MRIKCVNPLTNHHKLSKQPFLRVALHKVSYLAPLKAARSRAPAHELVDAAAAPPAHPTRVGGSYASIIIRESTF